MGRRVEPIASIVSFGAPMRAVHDTSGFASPAPAGSVLSRIQALGFTRGRNLSVHEIRERLDAMIAERRTNRGSRG